LPIYEYECSQCGDKFEIRRGLTDSDSDLKCPRCGAKSPRRVFSTFCTNQSGEACASPSGT
jgi:putative FmdB family regulatory protein